MKINRLDSCSLYADCSNIDDLLASIRKVYDANVTPDMEVTNVRITYECEYEDSVSIVLEINNVREETDKEKADRERMKKWQENRDVLEFERLKKKFEGKK